MQRLGDDLMAKMRNRERWIPADYLRDATVVAHLRNGDLTGARTAFDSMLLFVSRGTIGELRTELLRAHVRPHRRDSVDAPASVASRRIR